jgi:hypothetical protein
VATWEIVPTPALAATNFVAVMDAMRVFDESANANWHWSSRTTVLVAR